MSTSVLRSERAVIACLLEPRGEELPASLAAVVQRAPAVFEDERFGKIALAIRNCLAEGNPVYAEDISGRLNFEGATSLVLELAAQGISLELAEMEAKSVLQHHARRELQRQFNNAVKALQDRPQDFRQIVNDVKSGLEDFGNHGASRLPAIIDAVDFMDADLPEPKQVIKGILHQGSKLGLGGGSKSFKTWTLLDMAFSVAHGVPWISFPTTAGRVLYVNFELQPFDLQRRIKAIAAAKGIQRQREMLQVLNLRGFANSYKIILPLIQQACHKRDYALAVIDPTYKLYGGADENSAADISELLNAFETFTISTGAALAFASHFSKGNQAAKSSIDRVSGSGVFARDPDALITMTNHEEDFAFTVETTLRSFSPIPAFVVKWEFPLMTTGTGLDPAKLKQAKGGRAKAHDPEKLVAAIADATEEKPVSISAWASAAAVPRQTLQQYLPGLRVKGWIATSGEGSSSRQYLTDKGREAAKRGME